MVKTRSWQFGLIVYTGERSIINTIEHIQNSKDWQICFVGANITVSTIYDDVQDLWAW